MPLKRAASNHTWRRELQLIGALDVFLVGGLKGGQASFEICEGLGMRAVGLLLYGNLRFRQQ